MEFNARFYNKGDKMRITRKVFVLLALAFGAFGFLLANPYQSYQQTYAPGYNYRGGYSGSYGTYGGSAYSGKAGASQYDLNADYESAYNRYKRGDLNGAMPIFARLCEENNNFIACLSAGILLGQMITNLEQDKKLSSKERRRIKEEMYYSMMAFYTKSCNGGNYDACNNLAFYQYSTREQRAKDKKEQEAQKELDSRTMELYAQSCKAGNKEACQNLGLIYTDNLEDKNGQQNVNLSQAQNYYNKSCTMGDSVACFNLGVLRYNYAKSAADYAQAVYFFNQSCDNDYPEACLNLGIMYERGLTNDAKQDMSDAMQFYNKGCILGNPNACTYLSKLASKQSKFK